MTDCTTSIRKQTKRHKHLAAAMLFAATVLLNTPALAGRVVNIVDTAVAEGKLKTLVTAAHAADMDDELREGGPYTILAPSDQALETLRPTKVDALLGNKSKLIEVLNYHVLPGWVFVYEIKHLDTLTTRLGQNVAVRHDERTRVNNAAITVPDIVASNGVIHIIDTLLVPDSSHD